MFHKVRFRSSTHGATAGLIVDGAWLRTVSIGTLSRLFPWPECLKMQRLDVSPGFATFGEAFAYDFEEAA
jgi:hypothetical protein